MSGRDPGGWRGPDERVGLGDASSSAGQSIGPPPACPAGTSAVVDTSRGFPSWFLPNGQPNCVPPGGNVAPTTALAPATLPSSNPPSQGTLYVVPTTGTDTTGRGGSAAGPSTSAVTSGGGTPPGNLSVPGGSAGANQSSGSVNASPTGVTAQPDTGTPATTTTTTTTTTPNAAPQTAPDTTPAAAAAPAVPLVPIVAGAAVGLGLLYYLVRGR